MRKLFGWVLTTEKDYNKLKDDRVRLNSEKITNKRLKKDIKRMKSYIESLEDELNHYTKGAE